MSMNLQQLTDDTEDPEHTPRERAAAAEAEHFLIELVPGQSRDKGSADAAAGAENDGNPWLVGGFCWHELVRPAVLSRKDRTILKLCLISAGLMPFTTCTVMIQQETLKP